MTLDETVQKELAAARGYAEQGNGLAMDGSLDLVKIYALQLRGEMHFFAALKDFLTVYQKVAEVKRMGYKRAVPVELAAAEGYAKQGDISTMERHLSTIEKYMVEYVHKNPLPLGIFNDVDRVRATGYETVFPTELDTARNYALQGNALAMGNHLDLAMKCAGLARKDISEKVAKVRRDFKLRV